MTSKKPAGRAPRKLKLKKESLRDLDVKGKGKLVKGGATSFATCRCTAAATNCKLSCIAVCGGTIFGR